MKILVLGGTGTIGAHLIELLSASAHEILITSRSHHQSTGNMRYTMGDAHDNRFLMDLLQTYWDCIIDFMLYSTSEFQSLAKKLLAATDQYIFLSSSRVYATDELPVTESTARLLDSCRDQKYLGTDDYALTKARQEDILIQSGFANWTIVRPYITYGEYRMQLGVLELDGWLYRALQGRTIVFSKDIADHITTLSYAGDVAAYISRIIGSAESRGGIYQITTAKAMKWEKILEIYRDTLKVRTGKSPRLLLVNTIYDMIPEKPNYQAEYDRLKDRMFDSEKIVKALGPIDCPMETAAGLQKCLLAFLEKPGFQRIQWEREALLDKLTGERASLFEMHSFEDKIKYFLLRNSPVFLYAHILRFHKTVVRALRYIKKCLRYKAS